MQKSIFKRYLGITMSIVLLSFVMTGSVLMVFFGQYWRAEKKDLLTQNAGSIAGVARRFLSEKSPGQYELQTELLKTFISGFSLSIDADIFITDLEGRILLGNYPNSKLESPESVPGQFVSQAAKGMYEGCIKAGITLSACPCPYRTAAPQWGRCLPPPAPPP